MQLTLGTLLKQLRQIVDPFDSAHIEHIENAHSYRGYYNEIAFERLEGTVSVLGMIRIIEDEIGTTYQGYKGGNYYMSHSTPVWISEYGCCGVKVMGIVKVDDCYKFITEEDI